METVEIWLKTKIGQSSFVLRRDPSKESRLCLPVEAVFQDNQMHTDKKVHFNKGITANLKIALLQF